MLWYRPGHRLRKRCKSRRKNERKLRKKLGLNVHHVPPRHPDNQPKFKLVKNVEDHKAYHRIFAAAKSFEDCVAILKHDWWSKEESCK